MTNPIALIDGDILIYQAAFVGQEELAFSDKPIISPAAAEDALESLVEQWRNLVSPTSRVVFALSDANGCFRNDLYSFYKAGRKERPTLYGHLREFAQRRFETYLRPDLEADDVLGILSTSRRLGTGDKVIVTKDKDLLGVPGKIVRVPDVERTVHLIDADYFHLFQTLTGDAVDNYPGCPKVGPVNATRILDHPDKDNMPRTVEEMWFRVREAYVSRGHTEEDALLQARLARILRASDYDFINRKPILWTPPNYQPSVSSSRTRRASSAAASSGSASQTRTSS